MDTPVAHLAGALAKKHGYYLISTPIGAGFWNVILVRLSVSYWKFYCAFLIVLCLKDDFGKKNHTVC